MFGATAFEVEVVGNVKGDFCDDLRCCMPFYLAMRVQDGSCYIPMEDAVMIRLCEAGRRDELQTHHITCGDLERQAHW